MAQGIQARDGERTRPPDPRDGRRKQYDEYAPFKAQDSINEGNRNKGVPMKVTSPLADRFAHYVLGCRLSPYDAICRMREEAPDVRIPCLQFECRAEGNWSVIRGRV